MQPVEGARNDVFEYAAFFHLSKGDVGFGRKGGHETGMECAEYQCRLMGLVDHPLGHRAGEAVIVDGELLLEPAPPVERRNARGGRYPGAGESDQGSALEALGQLRHVYGLGAVGRSI